MRCFGLTENMKFPFIAISIALSVNNQVIVGIFYNPILDLLYSVIQGKDAFKNGRSIKCSGQKDVLKKSVFNYRVIYVDLLCVFKSQWFTNSSLK